MSDVSELRKTVHLIEKKELNGEKVSKKLVEKGKNLLDSLGDDLSLAERGWIHGILYHESYQEDQYSHILFSRRSIRKWKDKRVLKRMIETICRAGLFAPSSCNRQPVNFLVTRGKDVLPYKDQAFIGNAPTAIIVCVDRDAYKQSADYFSLLDSGACMQNMLLMAHDLGLGACWINTAPHETNIMDMRKAFAIPLHLQISGIIVLGYPDHTPKCPGRKELDIRWEL